MVISSFAKPIPARVLPSMFLNKDVVPGFLELARKYRQTKGIVFNTFLELESHVMSSFFEGLTLPIYPVGPILKLQRDEGEKGSDRAREKEEIKKWLDDQPPSSVVFLCFGSLGSFDEDQLREISKALEHSGHRFLWSLRRAPPKGTILFPTGYDNPEEILTDGFLERTSKPMVFGVPIATWPIDGEQQLNAFQMVAELGLGVEIKLDYRKDFLSDDEVKMVSAEEIERGINSLMQKNSEIERKMKEMSGKSKEALMEGGSSHTSFGHFIHSLTS
ncbi:anthocyanidin O-glucosyltransferase [Salix suchowensis]|nr:anthocyanidin O-glucosyltransferase [Salix suchowensis]